MSEPDVINREIAEALTAMGLGHLAFETATECPQDHPSTDVDTNDFGGPDYKEDEGWGIGVLCLTCIANSKEIEKCIDADVEYFRARKVRDAHQADPTWHPEWRVQGAPHDFTDPRYLRPAVRAVCDLKRWKALEIYRGDGIYIGNIYSTPQSNTEGVYVTERGEDALRNALHAAISEEVSK